MNKRQKKEKRKKYLPVIVDEFLLTTMTDAEAEKALQDYNLFRERFAYRKRYQDLKNESPLRYYFPTGQKLGDFLSESTKILRKNSGPNIVTQKLDDFKTNTTEGQKYEQENYFMDRA